MTRSVNQRNKELVWNLWQSVDQLPAAEATALIKATFHPDVTWFGPHPINDLRGREAVVSMYVEPLREAFPDLHRHCDVFLGSESRGEYWVSACGYLIGTFQRDWLGIPATGRNTYIHFGEHLRLEEGQIVESYLILDILGVARQAGFQLLPPGRGAEGGRVPGPPRGEGVLLTEQDPLESAKSRQLVWAMLEGLYRGRGEYRNTGMNAYWTEDMHWYGPTGIGSCYSLEQFREFHQIPWMEAFPDHGHHFDAVRMIGLEDGDILAEGNYAALGLWDGPFSVHRGTYLGIPPTGRQITMRDFDWYRRDGARLVQNWVPIDMIDIALQLGVDLMAELAEQRARRDEARLGV